MSLSVLTRGGGGGATASIFVKGLSETDIVTATNGSKTKNGVWNVAESRHEITKIKDLGTWTVTATDGEKTTTQDVMVDVITEYEIEMDYKLWLYRAGAECEDVTGGWGTAGYGFGSNAIRAANKLADKFYLDGKNNYITLNGILNAVDFTGYAKLKVEVNNTQTYQNYSSIQVTVSVDRSNFMSYLAHAGTSALGRHVYEIDVSNINQPVYIAVYVGSLDEYDGYVYNVWLE